MLPSIFPRLRSSFPAAPAINDLFSDFFADVAPFALLSTEQNLPAVDLWETPEGFEVEAEVPRLDPATLEVTLTGERALRIAGRYSDAAPEGATRVRAERVSGTFAREVHFPVPVNGDGIEAKLADGVLRIRLPKATQALPRRIEVKGAPAGKAAEAKS